MDTAFECFLFTETDSERASETKTQNCVVRRDRERHARHRQTALNGERRGFKHADKQTRSKRKTIYLLVTDEKI